MKNIINNYSSIEQLTNQYLNKQKSTEKKINGISFEEILKQQTQPVKFSKHASMRLTQRNINLSDDQSMRLQKGIAAADSKGVNDSLVLVDDIAFIVKEVEPNKISKISMRSKLYDVAKICSNFGGGGHSRAAGCTIKSGVESAVKKVLGEIKKVGYEK